MYTRPSFTLRKLLILFASITFLCGCTAPPSEPSYEKKGDEIIIQRTDRATDVLKLGGAVSFQGPLRDVKVRDERLKSSGILDATVVFDVEEIPKRCTTLKPGVKRCKAAVPLTVYLIVVDKSLQDQIIALQNHRGQHVVLEGQKVTAQETRAGGGLGGIRHGDAHILFVERIG